MEQRGNCASPPQIPAATSDKTLNHLILPSTSLFLRNEDQMSRGLAWLAPTACFLRLNVIQTDFLQATNYKLALPVHASLADTFIQSDCIQAILTVSALPGNP